MKIDVSAPFPHRDKLGEGPTWDAGDNTLVRVDFFNRAIHRLDVTSGAQHTITMPEGVAFAVPTSTGDLVVGLRDSVSLVSRDGEIAALLARIDHPAPTLRLNDGKIDPTGRVVFGSLSETSQPLGSCYQLGTTLDTIFDEVIVSNGLAWDLERGRFYYVDSRTGRIDVCDYDPSEGRPRNRRTFAEIPPADGEPDGLCLDEEGGIWVALFGGGAVRRFMPDGTHHLDVPLPVTYPTSVNFGGADRRTAFVTSAFHRLDENERRQQPLAGAVLVFEPGVVGQEAFTKTVFDSPM